MLKRRGLWNFGISSIQVMLEEGGGGGTGRADRVSSKKRERENGF